jgi:hypothetical protein
MRISILRFASTPAIGLLLVVFACCAPALAKTAKECDAEYAANKDAIKGSGEKKKDFVEACRAENETIPGGGASARAAPAKIATPGSADSGTGKTVKECDAEYAANKTAIKASGEKKKDFVGACRAGGETIPSQIAPAPSAAAQAAPAGQAGGKTARECDAEYKANKEAIKASGERKKDFIAACRVGTERIPSAAAPAPQAPSATPAPTGESAPSAQPTPAHTPVPNAPPAAPQTEHRLRATGPVSASEAQTQASCPSDTVVWVNTRSRIYHFKGTHNYGTTKEGTYMCESAAKAGGNRAAENEKHP